MAKAEKKDKAYLIRVGKRIAEIRKQKDITQMELGYRCDIEPPNMNRIEKGGNNLTILTLKKICSELGISISDFMQGL